MAIAGTIMHQSIRDQHATTADHLEAAWQRFQAFEAGATGQLCRTWETTRPAGLDLFAAPSGVKSRPGCQLDWPCI
jgi:hypothetical protein